MLQMWRPWNQEAVVPSGVRARRTCTRNSGRRAGGEPFDPQCIPRGAGANPDDSENIESAGGSAVGSDARSVDTSG